MATKSPGIYFKVNDNTAYQNLKTTTGTTIAVVGYAKRGPIGVPTEINSWNDFISTFGEPEEGFYSGIAVKNILAAGGAVLFNRVADPVTATPSNCIVKNPIAGTRGYTAFARSSDILVGTNGYVNGKIYAFNVADPVSNKNKDFFIKAPLTGKLSQTNVLAQILAQNEDGGTPGTWEAIIKNNIKGLYSFAVNGGTGSGLASDIGEKTFFVDLESFNTKDVFVQAISKAISTGENAKIVLTLSKSNTSEGAAGTSWGDTLDSALSTALGFSGNKTFKLKKNEDAANTITINIRENSTYGDLIDALDTACKPFGIRVFPNLVNKAGEGFDADNKLQIVFVLMTKNTNDKINLASFTQAELEDLMVGEDTEESPLVTKCLFSSLNSLISGENLNTLYIDENDNNFIAQTARVYGYESTPNGGDALAGFTVEYDDVVNGIVFETNAKGNGKTITVVPSQYGTFLFDEYSGCGEIVGAVEGADKLDINVYRDALTKKIVFETVSGLAYPTVAAAGTINNEGYAFGNFLNLEKDPSDANSVGVDDGVQGTDAVEAGSRDMVVFTSKETGSGTNTIVIETFTTKSPIPNADGTYDEKHDLTVSVDGLLKETFENISLNYADVENRFDTLINETPENGGSGFITVTIVKNDFTDPNVQLPDGVFKIGKPNGLNTDEDIKKADDISYASYNLYDYAVGSDGIPTDGGSDLFEEAMAVGTSALANKDLYDFHVIITPDDISETVQTAAIALCEDRGDAIAIIDPPAGLSKKAVINWHNGRGYGRSSAPSSNFAATYWPWCKIYDNTNGTGKYSWVMPSVVMAARYVSVDKEAGSWYAPAGEQNGRLSVIDIEQYPNQIDRDELYCGYNRVNPIVKFKDGLIMAYGEKTLQRTDSSLTKVHVRRMVIDIIKQSQSGLRKYIYQPNTTSYLGKISADVSAVLERFKAGGGISFYQVICDSTNNTTETSQQDIVNVDVAIVPNGTIEQINFSLSLNKSAETVTVS